MDIDPPSAQAAPAVVVIIEDWAKPEASAAGRAAGAAPAPALSPAKPAAETAAPAPIVLTAQRIRQAVAATLAETPDRPSIQANRQDGLRDPVFGAETPEKYKQFAKDFAYAKLPYCLGGDGLKFQPPQIGPITFGGLLALPFVVAAKVRGKCK
jgi:hypothetical protein